MIAPTLVVSKTEEEYARTGAHLILQAIRQCLSHSSGPCSLMLAGGTAPLAIYRQLVLQSQNPDPPQIWDRVTFFFGDERCVPPNHPESNFRIAQQLLFTPLAIAPDRIFRMHGEAPDPDRAAADYERVLPKPIDVLLLGMGEDAHTASLFPGDPCASRLLYGTAAVVAPKPPPQRITILPAVISQARNRFVLARGPSKTHALQQALQGAWNPLQYPVQWALSGPSMWLLDSAAAGDQISGS